MGRIDITLKLDKGRNSELFYSRVNMGGIDIPLILYESRNSKLV